MFQDSAAFSIHRHAEKQLDKSTFVKSLPSSIDGVLQSSGLAQAVQSK
jgi:hypothetical protein